MKKILKVFKSSKSDKSSASASSTPASSSKTPTTAKSSTTTAPPPAAAMETKVEHGSEKISTADYLKAISYRRTVYPLSDKSSVSDDRIVEIVEEVLKISPSAYNSQPMRVAILLGEHHKKFWTIIKEQAMPLLQGAGEEVVKAMSQRFDMFQAAYGTVSFWEDTATVKQSQETHAASAAMFPQWSEHANGILQGQIWVALELEGLGANLQHMNAFPPAEAELKKAFDIPESWSLKAHLNIGDEVAPHPAVPDKKAFSETLKVFKA